MELTEVSALNLGCQSPAPPSVMAHSHEQLNWTPMSPTLDQRKAEVQRRPVCSRGILSAFTGNDSKRHGV